ncbi:LOW QUALITY PROTEIN: hypothetical protein QYF61_027216 [Mycteria americana]|uniref:Uncharacterized protein n=1 Tax=Mycteria americana TaxID=33587 RepID=A0AAN7NM79_MYCAM|nr:LOW QUALITY PROTEIN: hypothetical protein QYF61_027216 [Mycteria americana]
MAFGNGGISLQVLLIKALRLTKVIMMSFPHLFLHRGLAEQSFLQLIMLRLLGPAVRLQLIKAVCLHLCDSFTCLETALRGGLSPAAAPPGWWRLWEERTVIVMEAAGLEDHRITESYRLEKTFKIIESNPAISSTAKLKTFLDVRRSRTHRSVLHPAERALRSYLHGKQFVYEDVTRGSVESLSKVKIKNIHCSLLLHQASHLIVEGCQRYICGMYPGVLRGQIDVIARQLPVVVESSWQSEDVPKDWKKADFTPIYKKKGGSRNYRPFSLTSIPGKVVE